MVGLIEVIVQQVSAIAVIALANGRGETGALVLFNYASQVFNSLNAVLALSIVLSAFPVLSARDGSVFDRTCAGSTRAVLLVACLGVAVIGAVAVPAAHVLARQPDQVPQLVAGFALFAPGLLGVGVLANLTRALLAIGRLKVACAAVAGSSLLGALAQVVLAVLVPTHGVVAALALGNSIGMIGAAIPLVFVTKRLRGKAAVQGVGRTTLTGVAAAAVSTVVGVGVCLALPASGKLLDAVVAILAVGCAVLVFGGVAFALDDGDLRIVLARLRQLAQAQGRRPGTGRRRADEPAARRLAVEVHASPPRRSRDRCAPAQAQPPARMRTSGQVPAMNTADQPGISGADASARRAEHMTRLERQAAFGIGIAAGIAGGCAVFASSNQAGTALLLLISLVFLLVGVEGTPLLSGGLGAELAGRRRAARAPPAGRGDRGGRRATTGSCQQPIPC